MCNCINEVKEKIQKEIAGKNIEYADLQINKVTCDGEAWIFTDNGTKTAIGIPFTAHHQPVRRKTKTTINMIATYCPFCGNEYVNETKMN